MKSQEELEYQRQLEQIDDKIEDLKLEIGNHEYLLSGGFMNTPQEKMYSTEAIQNAKKELRILNNSRERLVQKLTRLIENRTTEKINNESQNASRVIRAVQNLLFENYQSTDIQVHGENKARNMATLKEAIRYIVEEVMDIEPWEYDSIYSSAFNQKMHIEYAIRKIVEGADSSVTRQTLFVAKQTLFAEVWPEYYKLNYKQPGAWDIFNATGEIKAGLIRAGKPRYEKDPEEGVGRAQNQNGSFSQRKKKKNVVNHGEEVDRIVYNAMKQIFSFIEISTEDLFYSLAKPKSCGWNHYGCTKIIEARKCYPTPLDFYMLNSSPEYQRAHVWEYYRARERAGLEKVYALEEMMRVYQKTVGDYDSLEDHQEPYER